MGIKRDRSIGSAPSSSHPFTREEIEKRLQERTDQLDREVAADDYLLSMEGKDPRWEARKRAKEEIDRLKWVKDNGPQLPSDKALIAFYEAEGIDFDESAPASKKTPALTREHHAEVWGYEDARSAARVFSKVGWPKGASRGAAISLEPARLLPLIRAHRKKQGLQFPETVADILDMYAHPEKWKV